MASNDTTEGSAMKAGLLRKGSRKNQEQLSNGNRAKKNHELLTISSSPSQEEDLVQSELEYCVENGSFHESRTGEVGNIVETDLNDTYRNSKEVFGNAKRSMKLINGVGKDKPSENRKKGRLCGVEVAEECDRGIYENSNQEQKLYSFSMERINRIVKDGIPGIRVNQEAVFLVNKASVKFIDLFCARAYNSTNESTKLLSYKQLSSVASEKRRLDFLADFLPEKMKAVDALAAQKKQNKW